MIHSKSSHFFQRMFEWRRPRTFHYSLIEWNAQYGLWWLGSISTDGFAPSLCLSFSITASTALFVISNKVQLKIENRPSKASTYDLRRNYSPSKFRIQLTSLSNKMICDYFRLFSPIQCTCARTQSLTHSDTRAGACHKFQKPIRRSIANLGAKCVQWMGRIEFNANRKRVSMFTVYFWNVSSIQ